MRSISFGVIGLLKRNEISHLSLKPAQLWATVPGSALFSQQIHDVGGEFIARLLVLLQLLMVDLSDLGQFRPVI